MRVLLALLLAAAVALQLSAAQPVTTTVSDDAAESVAKAIQLAIAEQDGHTAAQLIAQAFATKEKPSLGVVITPQQRSTTPKVLPDNTKIISAANPSTSSDASNQQPEEDGAQKFAQGLLKCQSAADHHLHCAVLHEAGSIL